MVGVDIVNISRVELKDSFINKVLTKEEKNEFLSIKNDRRKKEYLAGRFAVKESIFKATQDINYLSYSCLNKENGQPYIVNHPEICVSISHDEDYAIAVAQIDY